MSTKVYHQILELVRQLSDEERKLLSDELKIAVVEEEITREMLLQEHSQLRKQGAFKQVESLYGKYARDNIDLSFENLEAAIHEHSWEDELDEFHKPD